MSLEIIPERIKIEKFEGGFICTITEKNWVKTGHFATPCHILYKTLLFELYNDRVIGVDMDNKIIEGEELEKILPQLLERGKVLPKENNSIFSLDK